MQLRAEQRAEQKAPSLKEMEGMWLQRDVINATIGSMASMIRSGRGWGWDRSEHGERGRVGGGEGHDPGLPSSHSALWPSTFMYLWLWGWTFPSLGFAPLSKGRITVSTFQQAVGCTMPELMEIQTSLSLHIKVFKYMWENGFFFRKRGEKRERMAFENPRISMSSSAAPPSYNQGDPGSFVITNNYPIWCWQGKAQEVRAWEKLMNWTDFG